MGDTESAPKRHKPKCPACGEPLRVIPDRDHEYGSYPNTGWTECPNECPDEDVAHGPGWTE